MVYPANPQAATVYQAPTMVLPPSQAPGGAIFNPPTSQPGVGLAGPQPVGVPEQLPVPPNATVPPNAVFGPPGAGVPPVVIGGGAPGAMPVPGPASTISVPVVDDDYAWDQISDVVSDYFTIGREQRARRGGEISCDGFIETVPQDGATVLEPHRRDSVGWFNRWESTFQSIRRRATVRVVPDANGYIVEVIVEKELEDLAKPEKATAGAATFRSDLTLPSSRLEDVSRTRQSPRWIPQGRDTALEQVMLAEIHGRLSGISGVRVNVLSQ
jgi:hypothetical protein